MSLTGCWDRIGNVIWSLLLVRGVTCMTCIWSPGEVSRIVANAVGNISKFLFSYIYILLLFLAFTSFWRGFLIAHCFSFFWLMSLLPGGGAKVLYHSGLLTVVSLNRHESFLLLFIVYFLVYFLFLGYGSPLSMQFITHRRSTGRPFPLFRCWGMDAPQTLLGFFIFYVSS